MFTYLAPLAISFVLAGGLRAVLKWRQMRQMQVARTSYASALRALEEREAQQARREQYRHAQQTPVLH